MAEHDPDTGWAAIARHDTALATVRDFAERSGAARVVAVVDTGDGRTAAVVQAEAHGPLTVTEGEAVYEVPTGALDQVAPRAVDPPRPLPASAWHVDVETGEVAAPPGAVSGLALGVLRLAAALGGRSVATADFATHDGVEVTIAARPGEPLVLAVGDRQFELPITPPPGE